MPPPLRSDSVDLRTEHDVVIVRQQIRKVAQEIGFKLVDQTKLVTATSELARNTVTYGGGGVLVWEHIIQAGREGLRLTFSDQGPGIANLEQAMKEGFTTGRGLGMGLPGARRLVNEFAIESRPGSGTRVTIVRWK
jgi:serine/threonine-protein kinase RsbT